MIQHIYVLPLSLFHETSVNAEHPLKLNNMKSVNAETSTQTEQYEVC